MRFFVSDIPSKSAEGASYNSHGRNPWSRKTNTFPGFGRIGANLEIKGSPKRLEDDLFSPQRRREHSGFTENSYEVFRISLYEVKALKARLITAMGETHGHENQSHFRVLAELTPIEEMRVHQNG
jgi:hypothetical protein